jgi:hypothetical protein
VNEGDSLKEEGPAGKRTRIGASKKPPMRTVRRAVEIEGADLFRKRRERLAPVLATLLTDSVGSLKQQSTELPFHDQFGGI